MKTKPYIAVLGGGESGTGAALLAKQQGYEVFLSDSGTIPTPFKQELQANHIELEESGHTLKCLRKAEEVVKSPGIPGTVPVVQKLRKAGIPVISDIEFAARFAKAPIIAITGSNGKTTTTALTAHIFKKAGLRTGMGGNIGHSFARLVSEGRYDYYIIEVSSFQLEDIRNFHPHVAILLNITPDHLDRYHNSFVQYVEAKFKITANQTKKDVFIYNMDDTSITSYLADKAVHARSLGLSIKKKTVPGPGWTTTNSLYKPQKPNLK